MKTLLALLLVAVGIGAAYWTTQRPGEGVDALRDDAMAAVERLRNGVDAVRLGALQDDNTAEAPAAPDTPAAARAGGSPAERATVDELGAQLNARIDAMENQLTGTMTAAEAGVVDERLARLEQQRAGAASAGAASAAGDTDQQLTGALQRMESLEGRLELLTRRLDESDPAERFDALDARLTDIATSVESLGTDTAAAAAQTDARIATVEERLGTVDARVATLAAGGSSGDGDTATDVNAVIEQRMASLEEKFETTRAGTLRVDALAERLDNVDTKLDTATGADEQLRQTVEALQTRVAGLGTAAEAMSIDTLQQEIREQLASLDAEVGTDNAPDVSALTDSLDATRERIQALESQVRNLPASSSEADDAQQTQSVLEAQIAALERRVETLPPAGTADPALADSISEVRERVNELSTRDFVTQEELRAQTEGKNVEYKIYFGKNSVDITPDAAQVLDSFVAQETNRTSGVAIFGFTDRAGPALYNQQLAQRRAQAVRSYLIQNGFDYTKISNVAGLGEDAAAALLDDEQEDAQQRVVVLYAAQR